jgi:hypothetical protein
MMAFSKLACPIIVVLATLVLSTTLSRPVNGQVSPEEHAKHYPGEAQGEGSADAQGSGSRGPGPGGGMSGGAGGMMGGGMSGMMEHMGAPKPKEMYPRLMDLPDLPMEERAEIEREAHGRMVVRPARQAFIALPAT